MTIRLEKRAPDLAENLPITTLMVFVLVAENMREVSVLMIQSPVGIIG